MSGFQNLAPSAPGKFAIQAINSGPNNQPSYVGYAPMGTLPSAPGWYISKLSYDGNGIYLNTTWATVSGDAIFTNYATYTYQ